MSDGIQLLPPPTPGWHYEVHNVSLGGSEFTAILQEKNPPPPLWYEPMLADPEYGQGLSVLLMLFMAAKRTWVFWQKRRKA